MPYSLVLSKDSFKFSSSHFTVFSETLAEHLHGHNYRVQVKVSFDKIDPQTEMAFDFKVIKDSIKSVCEKLDEKILIPQNSPFLKIFKSPHYPKHTEIRFQKRVYNFPDEEIFFVNVSNITSEALARFIHGELKKILPQTIQKISVAISETAGQTATFS